MTRAEKNRRRASTHYHSEKGRAERQTPEWKAQRAAAGKRRRDARRVQLGRFKVWMGCRECGYSADERALHFHHLDPTTKAFPIASARGRTCSDRDLEQEIAKCEVLCANCHAGVGP